MRKKLFTFIWALIFIMSITVCANSQTVEAANSKAVKSVDVHIDNKKFSKKTYTLKFKCVNHTKWKRGIGWYGGEG